MPNEYLITLKYREHVSQEFILKNIDKTKSYFSEEIKPK